MSAPETGTAPAANPLDDAAAPSGGAIGALEQRGIEPVPESERDGNPLQLFWVWFAANISVLGLPLGVSLVVLGLSVWQSILVAVLGAFGSFAVVGLISVAGRRGGAPSLTLSRAVFGTRGNAGPAAVALVSRLGWETVNTSTAALAVVTIVSLVAGTGGDAKSAPVIAVLGVVLFVAFTVAVSGMGHGVILLVQKWSTWIFGGVNLLILGFLVATIDWSHVAQAPHGSTAAVVTGIGTIAAGTGIGWANSGADMARYQAPRVRALSLVMSASAGAGIPLVVMISMGSMLGTSDAGIAASANPLDAIRDTLPHAVAVIYLLVSFVGLLLSNHLSVYSAGLTTLTLGLRVKRVHAVLVDVVVTTTGSLLFLLVADGFYGPFITFISLLAVPISAWVGIFLVDMARRRHYDPEALLDLSPGSAYFYRGGVRWAALGPWLIAIVVAALFLRIAPGEQAWYTGPFADTWIGANGMAWVLSAVIGGVLYALVALRTRGSAS
ncbi:purine-cytosine permease family protein [Brachybacterium sacelli]|uniref:Purine-cytosine permease-like protein n=1 Tax=Brachybacterium sacelli TaxID=173364 RepID=A0ABS4X6K8_9MICO|nr:cytosine permease [Brachybacterium sacelli]MBP2384102.1 purine-cytosine permease-like protein [Brachybacterium sacelli]